MNKTEQEEKQEESQEFLDLKDYVEDIRGMYKKDLAQGTFNALILGPIGSGKTNMIGTARKPVLLHSFDPGGTKTLRNFVDPKTGEVSDLIKSGDVIPDSSFEGDDSEDPSAWKNWEREFKMLRRKDKFFEQIGTYAIDSFTMWVMSLKYHLLERQGREDGVMARHDWQILGNTVRDTINVMTALPCDLIMTGHLTTEKDDVTGKIQTNLQAIPSLQNDLPMLFDEIYCLENSETSKGINVSLITRNTGKYEASTRIGSGGVFDTRETPDIKTLLKKAGYPYKDKRIPI